MNTLINIIFYLMMKGDLWFYVVYLIMIPPMYGVFLIPFLERMFFDGYLYKYIDKNGRNLWDRRR